MVAPDVLALPAPPRKYHISVQVLGEHLTAVVRAELAPDALADWLADAFHAVHQHLDQVGILACGPPFARLTLLGDVVAVEAGLPVTEEVPGDGHVEPSILAGCCAAVTTHWGPREHLSQAYEAVRIWLARQECVPAGPHWEVYYLDSGAEPDPRRWHIEVVVPYRLGQPACVPAGRPPW
jgi:effector-binding domain-containing protein